MNIKTTIGLIINPIAGMGGSVALKGTDGQDILARAITMGAVPKAGQKAARALKKLFPYREQLALFTCSGDMGEKVCKEMGLPCQVVYEAPEKSSPQDTMDGCKALLQAGVTLILFAGGDGTARNLCQAIAHQVPVVGIPAGVKIQSAVFALSPEAAGDIVAALLMGQSLSQTEREVVDLDEQAYRQHRVSATLYGTMLVPHLPALLQSMKQGGFFQDTGQQTGIARYLMDHMEPDRCYALGPGTTTAAVLQHLSLTGELLGVNVVQNHRLIARDATEETLWTYAQQGQLSLILSPIGGQGFLLGRGNHQFSSRVLGAVGKKQITVISPLSKLLSITDHTLHIDCEDVQVRQDLLGYYHVLTDYGHFLSLPCV